MMEKMQREKILEVDIKPGAVADFTQHCDKWSAIQILAIRIWN